MQFTTKCGTSSCGAEVTGRRANALEPLVASLDLNFAPRRPRLPMDELLEIESACYSQFPVNRLSGTCKVQDNGGVAKMAYRPNTCPIAFRDSLPALAMKPI